MPRLIDAIDAPLIFISLRHYVSLLPTARHARALIFA